MAPMPQNTSPAITPKGNILFSSSQILYKFSPNGKKLLESFIETDLAPVVSAIGNFWLARATNSLTLYSPQGKKLNHIWNAGTEQSPIILQDRSIISFNRSGHIVQMSPKGKIYHKYAPPDYIYIFLLFLALIEFGFGNKKYMCLHSIKALKK